MSLLTDREIKDIEMYARSVTEWNLQFARAIEAAVIKKLATVSVASHIDKDKFLFTTEAIAAARVQALEALENSVDYAEGELTERTRMWSNLPSRAKHLTVLKELADAHVAAITAIKQHLEGKQ